jgi:hypothetical protein
LFAADTAVAETRLIRQSRVILAGKVRALDAPVEAPLVALVLMLTP